MSILTSNFFRYYTKKYKTVVIDFLDFIELQRATANDLRDAVVEYLSEINLDIKKMIGLGTDGANAMCGSNHSLYTLLREMVIFIIL